MGDDATELTPASSHAPLPADLLYRQCDLSGLSFDTTAELEPLDEHLGQHRAVEALGFGLQMPHDGYNIYLLGSTGLGKRELLDSILDANSAQPSEPASTGGTCLRSLALGRWALTCSGCSCCRSPPPASSGCPRPSTATPSTGCKRLTSDACVPPHTHAGRVPPAS